MPGKCRSNHRGHWTGALESGCLVDSEESPFALPSRARPAGAEAEAGAGDEIPNRAADHYFARLRPADDARRHFQRETGEGVPRDVALARMHARADGNAAAAESLGDGPGAADRPRRSAKRHNFGGSKGKCLHQQFYRCPLRSALNTSFQVTDRPHAELRALPTLLESAHPLIDVVAARQGTERRDREPLRLSLT